MADNLRLVILTFPQHWEPKTATLSLNALLIPGVSPVDDPLVGNAPKFADHVPALRVVTIGNLDSVPTTGDPQAVRFTPVITHPNPPVVTRPSYQKLVTQVQAQGVTISGSGALTAPSASRIRKALPPSYLNATGATPNGNTTTTDEFGCEIRTQPAYPPGPKATTTGWGPLISYALRQPLLATALGLRYEMHIHLTDPATFSAGGWLFVEIAASDPWPKAAVPGQIRLYAARLPALAERRQVFASVLFPVDASGTIADTAFNVAETYDDGFAQIVHLFQPEANDAVVGDSSLIPAASDIGIQIGWDDEQVVAWQNGQVQILNERMAGSLDAQTPLGVLGYRVDVADVTSHPPKPGWHSLVHSSANLPQGFGHFHGELCLEPTALRAQDPNNPATVTGDAWLPRYFANWRGGSLVAADPVPKAMLDGKPITVAPDPVGVLLSYGRSYAFRVRLADLSQGGPVVGDGPVNLSPAGTASIDFLRTVPPKKPGVSASIPAGKTIPEALIFTRPLIGYPEVLYTPLGQTGANRQQIAAYFTQNSHPGTGVVVGLPDPDAQTLELVVEVRTPLHDVAGDGVLDPPFRQLYTTTRTYPALPPGPLPVDPGLRVDLAYVDAPSIVDWAAVQPATGPLVIPRARDVRITARALTRTDPTYFSPAATTGLPASLSLRAELRDEPSLLIKPVDGSLPLRGFLFNRPAGTDAPPVSAQLAQELGILASGLAFSAPPGRRIAFGASKGLRHTLSGDGSTITFASQSELLRQWVIALVVDLERDWTWDGLANANTLTIQRDGQTVGSLTIPRTLGAAAVADPANWDRRRTLLVFFDGVDPHEPTPSGFPEALQHAWTINAATVTETGTPVGVSGSPTLKPGTIPPPVEPDLNGVSQPLTLPISIPPAQIPEIASVGLALSPFTAGPGYATTAPRSKALWIELTAPIQNGVGDALFARVLTHGPDPLLYDATPSTSQQTPPPLVLDPELMREITPGESDDRAGLNAMTRLEQATDSKIHFLLPLPPGVDPSDPDLFGFYSYEFRIGHAGDPHDHRWWSTAQGRFGRPLQVNGVQHPAPTLICRAGRRLTPSKFSLPAEDILATATYATPMLNGQPLVRPFDYPKTDLYFFLYAQVVQADAASNRNVLLIQRPGVFLSGRDQAGINATFNVPFTNLSQRDRVGGTIFRQAEIGTLLEHLGLPLNLPLSVLAVELLPGGVGNDLPNPDLRGGTAAPAAAAQAGSPSPGTATAAEATAAAIQDPDPLSLDGRPRRILRVSPLVQVAAVC